MKPAGKTFISLIIFCLFIFQGLKAQSFLQSLQQYNTNYPQENIYVHFDKSVYYPGETIWFKAYLKSQNFPSQISTNFYIELLDESGKLIERKKIPIYEATAAGSFDLPAKFNGKGVILRAYTSWQLNFDAATTYSQFINISSGAKLLEQQGRKRSFELNFFPEGGDLIADISSGVAFTLTDKNGYPANVSGIIKDGSGKLVTNFASVHDGMGKFTLLPAFNQDYTAEWTDVYGVEHISILPKVKPGGITLHIEDKGS
jgi:hypothetical protein